MNGITKEGETCITEFWNHDKEDIELDADLLGLMKTKQTNQKRPKPQDRSPLKGSDPSFSNQSPKRESRESMMHQIKNSPKDYGGVDSQKVLKVINKLTKKSLLVGQGGASSPGGIVYTERKFNPDYGQLIDPNMSPVMLALYQESQKRIQFAKKPSFNVGLVNQHLATMPEESMKVSTLLRVRSELMPQQTLPPQMLPSLNPARLKTSMNNPHGLPLYKMDASPPRLREDNSYTRSSSNNLVRYGNRETLIQPISNRFDNNNYLMHKDFAPRIMEDMGPGFLSSVGHRDILKSPELPSMRDMPTPQLKESPSLQPALKKWSGENDEILKTPQRLPRIKSKSQFQNPLRSLSSEHDNMVQARVSVERENFTLIENKFIKLQSSGYSNEGSPLRGARQMMPSLLRKEE